MTLDTIKGHLVVICIWKDPGFYFAEATSTYHRIWNQNHHWRTRVINIHHRGSRHPSLPPFKRAGLTPWFHSHSQRESISGKAGYDSVEFCHLCTYQQIKGGASVTPAPNRLLDLDCSCWLCSLVDNTLCFTRPSSGFGKILLRRRVHKTWS